MAGNNFYDAYHRETLRAVNQINQIKQNERDRAMQMQWAQVTAATGILPLVNPWGDIWVDPMPHVEARPAKPSPAPVAVPLSDLILDLHQGDQIRILEFMK